MVSPTAKIPSQFTLLSRQTTYFQDLSAKCHDVHSPANPPAQSSEGAATAKEDESFHERTQFWRSFLEHCQCDLTKPGWRCDLCLHLCECSKVKLEFCGFCHNRLVALSARQRLL